MTESVDLPEAFFLPLGEGHYEPTYATMSPWGAGSQHGGPPSALLATCMDHVAGGPGLRLARITVDFLRPIPRKECAVEVSIARPGGRVRKSEATMSVGGQVVVHASAWHIATGGEPPALGVHDQVVEPLPVEQPQVYFAGLGRWGYGEAIEWRFASGGYDQLGPAKVWTRMRIPLIAGRELTGLQHALTVADSANGLSNVLPLGEWLFIPPTMTLTLLRHPAGEWVYLDAQTTLANDGVGIARADLADDDGIVGTAMQPLLVAPV